MLQAYVPQTRITSRCTDCELPMRSCVCNAQYEIQCPLQIDVLTHQLEQLRTGSSGNLIRRVFPDSRPHIWHMEKPLTAADIAIPGRDIWVLHPSGTPAPANIKPETVQVVLLDGSWSETAAMAREVSTWGRLVSLPLSGPRRFWLRDRSRVGRYSTAEALLYLLDYFNLEEQRDELRIQFELHVYASMLARGRNSAAEEFLTDSIIQKALPEYLEQYQQRCSR